MKKLIAKILTLVLSATFVLSMFVACDWVTTNTDRDYNQVVASVNIDSEKLYNDEITKRELITNYLSYAYQYVQYGYYTQSQAYEMVLDNLVSNKVIVQKARLDLAASKNVTLKYEKTGGRGLENDYVKHLKAFLTDYEYAQAIYQVRDSVNSMIDSFVKEEEKDPEEDETITIRTTPTIEADGDMDEAELKEHAADSDEKAIVAAQLGDAHKAEVEAKISLYDLNAYLYANYAIDFSGERLKAVNQMFDFLEENGFILEGEKKSYLDTANPDKVLNTTYFQSLIVSSLESAVIAVYEDSLIAQIEGEYLSNDGLWEQYVYEYESQKALYKNDVTAYEAALNKASDKSFVLYCPYEGYGYVANLLIGFSEAESALLSEYSAKKGITDAQIKAYRTSLLSSVKASDQRASWVQSNYGEYAENAFTFGEKYRTSSLENISSFIGTVVPTTAEGTEKEDENGVKKTVWTFEKVEATEIPYNTFYSTYVQPVLGDHVLFEEGNNATIKTVANYSEEVFNKIEDLLFAFSTDPGCLGTEYGYLYSPYTNTYVEEFAAASKAVIAQGEGAYTVVVTDFGYHIILCTKVVSNPYDVEAADQATEKAKFVADLANEGSLAFNYREVKKDSIVSEKISKHIETEISPFLKDGSTAVTYFEKTYSDLITEESEDEHDHDHNH